MATLRVRGLQRTFRFNFKRRFSTNQVESDITKSKPSYVSRVILTTAVVGGGYAYYTGLTDDVMEFMKMRFSFVDDLTSEKSNGTVYKLPKPNKINKSEELKVIKQPPPSLSEITIDSDQIKEESPSILNQIESEVIHEIKDDVSEISEEMVAKYHKLKNEVSELMVSSEIVDAVDNVVDIPDAIEDSEPPKVYASEEERFKAEVAALQRALEQKSLTVEELQRELKTKSNFITDNLEKLEEGRRAYDESAGILEEMRVEYQEAMIQQMEQMEGERRDRLKKLRRFGVDIRAMEQIMNWYSSNNQFFVELAELNCAVSKLEDRMNRGLPFDNELKYLLDHIPSSFVSHRLFADLNQMVTTEGRHPHIHSQKQLYDRFSVLEGALRETAMTPHSGSLWGNLLAKVFSSLLVREEIDRKGTSAHDRISRAGYSMKFGDLGSALRELNHLDEDVLFPAQNWLKSARERLLGVTAVRMVKAELLSRSVRMVQNE